MRTLRFENIKVVLAEPNREIRQDLRSALVGHGFRDITDVGTVRAVEISVKNGTADLLIANTHLPEGDVCDVVRRARHHEIGANPFLLIIMLIDQPTTELVHKVFNSGTDDLLVKPLIPKQLLDRVDYLARGRKPFVVTHDYIGPDRRREARADASSAPLIEVPNPLKVKAGVGINLARMQEMIDVAASQLNEHKMERHAVQIRYLVEHILPLYSTGKTGSTLIRHL